MKSSKHPHLAVKSLKFGALTLSALLALLANKASAADTQYFGGSGGIVNGGSYSWDDLDWSALNGSSAGPFNSPWLGTGDANGDFARFYGGAGDTYTVTTGSDEQMAGMYLNAGSGVNLIVNDDGSGNGTLDVQVGALQATGPSGFAYKTQGFLTGGGVLTINENISGAGGVEEESGGGHLQLYGANTYTGGTLFISSSTFVDYNNNASFGAATSPIGYNGTTFSIMNNTGPSTVNLPNNVDIIGTVGVNFIGNSATESGNWSLGVNNLNIRNNGVGTTETLSGVLSGTGGSSKTVNFSGANGGTILLSGQSTYNQATTLGISGDANVTLQLGVANAIASTSKLTLVGGTLNPGGFAQAFSGTLGMTTSSKIDFSAGSAAVSFANSSGNAWAGTLNLINWSYGDLQFGSNPSGLTSAQLNDITFNGADQGLAALDSNGFLILLPEPSTWALGLAGLGVLYAVRRRA